MKTHSAILGSRVGPLAAVLLSVGATAWPAETTLKEAYKGHFYIGASINRTIATGTAVRVTLGQVNVNRTLDQVVKDTALVKAQFNQIVPENDLCWAFIHPREGADGYDFAPADAFVNFGLSNNMYIVGQTLVCDRQTPDWVFLGTAPETLRAAPGMAGGNPPRGGRRATREELLQRMRDHIRTVVGRYKGKIKVWDVVDEALAEGGTDTLRSSSLWLQIIGPDFVAKAFEYAHEADPDAILRYNDHWLEIPTKRRNLITLIKQLQEQNVPVMAIGSKTHINAGTTIETIDKELTELETLGLPIHITELDVDAYITHRGDMTSDEDREADRRQAIAYAAFFRALVEHEKSVKVVTFRGANDAVSWLAPRGRPLLFDGNDLPKPAFDAVIRAATVKKE